MEEAEGDDEVSAKVARMMLEILPKMTAIFWAGDNPRHLAVGAFLLAAGIASRGDKRLMRREFRDVMSKLDTLP